MATPEGSAQPASRIKEFLRGAFFPLLFTSVGLAAYPFWSSYDYAHDNPNQGQEAFFLAAALAFCGSAALAVRWWGRARWRAYGVISGFVGLPPTLLALFVGWVIAFNIPLAPR